MIPDSHAKATVIDGLIISKFSRGIFEAMRAGGITAANCTCSVWENFTETAANVAWFKRLIDENADIVMQIHGTADIERAKAQGKVGIILGWQNSSGYGDNLDFVRLFEALGVKIVQITYNTANSVGCGCYESHDGGLTDFGRELIGEMNRCGVLVDLSHVGPVTSRDAILASRKPVAYTHCLPSGLKAHPRNKSDEQLRFIGEHGGFVGLTTFPPFMRRGTSSTVTDYVDAIDYVINLIGEESVGIGTDMGQDQPRSFFEWITKDKGNGRKLVDFGEISDLGGLERLDDFPNLTRDMERRGWTASRIERVLGANWMKFLDQVWAPEA
jgi:membrane dipeptidase